jgi:hypothetical protein
VDNFGAAQPVEARGTSSTRPSKRQGKRESDFLGRHILCAQYFQKIEVPMVVGFVFFAPLEEFIADN